MKKLIAIAGAFLCGITGFAKDVSLSPEGQNSPSEKARYVLRLVRNGRVDLLNKYFDEAPWMIETEVNAYSDSSRTVSVALFCVAVELGNVDVVKAFIEHGYGPTDLCRVQKFTTRNVVVSRAERLLADGSGSESSNAASGSEGTSGAVWFSPLGSGGKAGREMAEGFPESYVQQKNITDRYTQVWTGLTTPLRIYFANPLDFASGEMFEYLWEQGFRSNSLFTEQALAEAKRLNRMDVWQYIVQNKPQMLADKPAYISKATYQKLLQEAARGMDTAAYALLENKVLGQNLKTSEQARALREQVHQMASDFAMELLSTQAQVKGLFPQNTGAEKDGKFPHLGIYASLERDLKVKEEQLMQQEKRAAREKAAAAAAEAKKQAEAKAAAEAAAEKEATRKALAGKYLEGARKTQSAFLASPTLPEVVKAAVRRKIKGQEWISKITVYRATECERARISLDTSRSIPPYSTGFPTKKDMKWTVWEIKVEGSYLYGPLRRDGSFSVSTVAYPAYISLIEEKGEIIRIVYSPHYLIEHPAYICQQSTSIETPEGEKILTWKTVPVTLVGTWTAPPYKGPMKF